MNSAKDVNITERAKTLLRVTRAQWSCSASSAHSKAVEVSAPASTTAQGASAGKKVASLKPNDPYPTWPFTQVDPKSLDRWCRKNLKPVYQIEEAPF